MTLRARSPALIYILHHSESQGRPPRPALEQVYRQAAACVTQLGLLGAGAAAYADIQKDLLEF